MRKVTKFEMTVAVEPPEDIVVGLTLEGDGFKESFEIAGPKSLPSARFNLIMEAVQEAIASPEFWREDSRIVVCTHIVGGEVKEGSDICGAPLPCRHHAL